MYKVARSIRRIPEKYGSQPSYAVLFMVVLVEESMGFHSWLTWWFNHLPDPSIYPKTNPHANHAKKEIEKYVSRSPYLQYAMGAACPLGDRRDRGFGKNVIFQRTCNLIAIGSDLETLTCWLKSGSW